jgi:hypothetical protein
MKQTTVEWLIDQLEEHIRKSAHNELGTIRTSDYRIGLRKAIDFCEQAKEMEKRQIIDSWNDGLFGSLRKGEDNAEQYYNETFKNK